MADAAAVRRLVRAVEEWSLEAPSALLFAFQVKIDRNYEKAAADIAAMIDDDAPPGACALVACALLNIARDQFIELGNDGSAAIMASALRLLEQRPSEVLHLKAGGFDA